MHKVVCFFSLVILISGCSQNLSQQDIDKINGYWEIEKVVLPDGETKDFTMNTTYEYFEINSNKGFRRKGTPRFDGKFEGNDIVEDVTIILQDGKATLNYATPFMKWSERLKSISDDKMVLINEQENEYHYKRTAPINLFEDGEKAQ